MQTTCPNCNVQLELPDGMPADQHLKCPNCNNTFVLHAGVAPLTPDAGFARNVGGGSSAKKIPGLTLTAFIIFYALFGLGIIGSLGQLPRSMPGILFCFLFIAFTLVSHFGKNWARITLTSLIGAGFLGMLGNEETVEVAFVAMVVLAAPIVFIWLPCSNRWFKEKKAEAKRALQ